MALWKQALAKLRGTTAAVSPPDTAVDADSEQGVAVEEIPAGETAPVAMDRDVLARELQLGIQVSIGDLETCAAGWRYRGHPVMVFGTDAPELEDPQRRRDFFSLVHLYPCCGALHSEARSIWIGTDLQRIDESHGQGPFQLCKNCLEAAAGRGASPAGFQFASHVRSHSDSYFADTPCYWQPGSNRRPLQPPAAEADSSCPHCGCAAPESGWQLDAEDTRQLALEAGCCVLCAERRVDGCLHLEGEQLLAAARVRYRNLISQASRSPAPSWKLAEAMLPLGWQPLLQSLQRVLPPPELFFSYAESVTPAVLAWPSLQRGVVEKVDAEGAVASGWNLWTRAQIEAELGFKLR